MLAVFPGCTFNFFSLSSVFLHDISGPNFTFLAIMGKDILFILIIKSYKSLGRQRMRKIRAY